MLNVVKTMYPSDYTAFFNDTELNVTLSPWS